MAARSPAQVWRVAGRGGQRGGLWRGGGARAWKAVQAPGGRPQGRAGGSGVLERPDQRLGLDATRSTRSRDAQRVAEKERERERPRNKNMSSQTRGTFGAPEGNDGGAERPRAGGQSAGGPGAQPLGARRWRRGGSRNRVPRRDTPPPGPEPLPKRRSMKKKMFLTDRAQLLLCCYPRREHRERRESAPGSLGQWGCGGGGVAAPGQRRAPRAEPPPLEPAPPPSGLSAAVPGKLGETCWK